jgi:hypothetical protein
MLIRSKVNFYPDIHICDPKEEEGESYIKIGDEFVVFFIAVYLDGHHTWGKKIDDKYWVMINHDKECATMASVPLSYFDIMNSTVSKYWKISFSEDKKVIAFEPQEFVDNIYFFDDVEERVPEVVEQFWDLKRKLEEEHERN